MKNTRKRKLAINSSVIVIGAVIVTVLLNMLLISLDAKIPLEIDLTRDEIYQLTDETLEVVDKIDKETKIMLLYDGETVAEEQERFNLLVDIIGKYTKRNENISLKTIDYTKEIVEEKYQQAFLSEGLDPAYAMIFEQGDDFEIAEAASYASASGNSLIENVITNNLANFIDGNRISGILMTTGHNEKQQHYLSPAFQAYGYGLDSINLLKDDIPQDGKYILIINAPSHDFSTEEIEKIDRFLDNGGNVQIYFDPMISNEALPKLESYLKDEWAIERDHKVIVDMDNRMGASQTEGIETVTFAELTDDKLVQPIASGQRNVVYSSSNPLRIAADKPQSVELSPVLVTKSNAYLKDLEKMSESKSSDDETGTFNVLVSASRKNYTAKEEIFTGKMLVCGSSYTMDSFIVYATYGNEDLLINSINWMRGSEAGITVREKELPQTSLNVTNANFWPWFIVLVVVIPIGVIAAGVVVWMKRRFK